MELSFLNWETLFPSSIFTTEVFVCLGWLLIGKVFLLPGMARHMRKPEMLEHRVFKVPLAEGQRKRELIASWHFMAEAVVAYLLLRFGLLRVVDPTFLNVVVTFVIFFVWVEVYYFFSHWAMHEFRWLAPVHVDHHRSLIVTPYSAMAMSSIEKWVISSSGWFAGIAAASWFVDVSASGIAAYFVFNNFINLGGHSNTEGSPNSLKMARFGFGSPTTHALHHVRFKANYGFSTTFLDRLFGTYSPEADELRARAVAGNGNTNLKRPENRSKR